MHPLDRLRSALAGRYDIEQELGRGGMAVVFLGRDLKLERRVAIKVFEHEGRAEQVTERFLREIRIAAQLQHPNILPVHESGEAEGLVYYVMPYVAGATLRERLEREGPLPIADAVRIAREVAEALDHAHQAGVVHRDIKPDNIMLSGGVAVVADFGIARALEQGGGKLTDTGLAIGTPTYMSPEQATASPQVDGRADIYALGCVLYEMLAGAPPFSGPTAQAVMARHTADAVPPLSTVRDVPPALEAAVVKALAKVPADRWPTGRAFAEALARPGVPGSNLSPATRARWLRPAGAIAATMALMFVIWQGWSAKGNATVPASPVLVAVLPFQAVDDTAHVELASGLSEGVTTALVQVDGLGVLPQSRVQTFADRVLDQVAVGRELGVHAVLSATVRGTGNRFRVTAQLMDIATGNVRWAHQFDGEQIVDGKLLDLFTVQDSIVVRIVDELRPHLDPAARARLARGVRTRDPEAFRLYQEARRFRDLRTEAGLAEAVELLRRALERDSLFADAWAALADVISMSYLFSSETPAENASAVRRALDRSIELDSANPLAFIERGWLRAEFDWDWERSRRDMRRAAELAPGSADVALGYGLLLSFLNEPESSLAQVRRAVSLDPTNALIWANLGTRFAFARMPDSALWASRRATALDSGLDWAHHTQMFLHLHAGRRAEAESSAARYRRFAGDRPIALALAAEYYGSSGSRARAQQLLDSLVTLSRTRYVPPAAIGLARLSVGDRSGAMDGLERAARERDPELMSAIAFRTMSLRGWDRFEALRRQVFGDRPLPWSYFP